MHDADGIGLAATQVGILRRFFVFRDEEEDHVVVNPEITTASRRDGGRRGGLPVAWGRSRTSRALGRGHARGA